MRRMMDWGNRGNQDENGLEEEYTHTNRPKKVGLASRRPWQEGGSQESKRNRQGAMFMMLDNFVGEMPSKEGDMGQDQFYGG